MSHGCWKIKQGGSGDAASFLYYRYSHFLFRLYPRPRFMMYSVGSAREEGFERWCWGKENDTK